ncbi:hypothetical protein BWO91_15220 [Plantibacter flavus]|uniref:CPBP family intramembrane glutamic endopeptidase n=1 Tax=Plantibacter flavus TaxID=150123 RepID=UPI00099C666F|nr:CPBP family intramembrane glutamic endopeptidase [Plantibacter flavus]AQX81141.1 hypothetical protein BWO91_15220 [Plantibacter flavus]
MTGPTSTSPRPGSRQERAEARRAEARLPYAPAPDTRWGTPTAIVTFIAIIGLLVVVELARAFGILSGDIGRMLQWVIFDGGILVALAVVCRNRGSGSWVKDFGLRFRWFDVFIGLGSAIGIQMIGAIVTEFVTAVSGEAPKSNIAAPSPELLWVLLNTVFAAAIVAPFCEELLFRGLLLRGFRNSILRGRAVGGVRRGASSTPSTARRRAAAVVSVGASALIFAVVHLYEGWGSPPTMVALGLTIFVLGTVNGVYAAATRRLGPGIWTHVFFNGITVLVMLGRTAG